MAKLFPPVIEGAIPSFYSEDGIVVITIPFSMNRAVSSVQVGGFVLKAKTIQSSTYLFTKEITDSNLYDMESSPMVNFQLSDEELSKLKVGQFYKFQIAYLDTIGEVGYFSTVGVGKYTTKPDVSIAGLEFGLINSHNYEYMGVYSQEDKDVTERVYSYRFDVYDSEGNIFVTSGDQLHNSSNDIELYESYDTFDLAQDLEIDQTYYIKYTVETNNGATISSPRYRIMQKISIDPEIQASLEADLDFDNGYINLNLIGTKNNEGMEEPVTGAFLITRACDNDGYTTWEEISRFKLAAQTPSRWLWRDFTIEQGKTYKYSLQQYNDAGLYSNKILSNEVYADFEDAFLFDGSRQLKIKYNPKVSSFKTDVLETKVDTIGSKHPFIFRNGRVCYKEFPISGLISYLMDEENLFMSEEEFAVEEKTTNLIGSNLTNERIFKLKVLEWLTNGEAKLFRSPTEGNYIVRLMNTSLAPNDTLGRMLHTFSTTAYEVADFTYQNLNDFDFIQLTDPETETLRWETVRFAETKDGKVSYLTGVVNQHPAVTIRLSDMTPGSKVRLYKTSTAEDYTEIEIGVTGSYYIDVGVEINRIELPQESTGSMTYSFYSTAQNQFNKIDNVSVSEIPVRQFIGEHDVIQEIEYVKVTDPETNITEYKKNPKLDIIQFYVIQAAKRSVEKAQIVDGKLQSLNGKDIEEDVFTLYALGKWVDAQGNDFDESNTQNYYRPGYANKTFVIQNYYDPMKGMNKLIKADDYDPSIYVNGNQNSLDETTTFEMMSVGPLESLDIGNGAMAEVSYQIRNIDYNIEDDPNWKVLEVKNAYVGICNALAELLKNAPDEVSNEYCEEEKKLREQLDSYYNNFIETLILEQEAESEAEGKI